MVLTEKGETDAQQKGPTLTPDLVPFHIPHLVQGMMALLTTSLSSPSPSFSIQLVALG
jgi:hypothetical protein